MINMIVTKPKVRLLAYTQPVDELYNPIDASKIEALVVAFARSTRSIDSIEDIYINSCAEDGIPKYIAQYMKMKHFTVFEFIDFTFEISGISRACSHELVRHRTATYLQQSQRHVDLRDRGVVVPPKIEDDDRAFYVMNDNDKSWRANYAYMVDTIKIPKEDARFIAPNAIETRVIMKIDGRNLLHFLKLRTDMSAMWEIRDVANLMWLKTKEVCPNIFSTKFSGEWV